MELFSPTVAALVAALVVAGPLSVAVTKIVDFVRNLIDTNDTMPRWVWNVAAFVVGLVIALGWGINILAPVVETIPALSDMAGTQDTWGQILTGLIIGAMAGFWHEKMAAWSAQSHSVAVPRG